MPRARRSSLFRFVVLIPMIMLGKELFYFAQGMRTNHWIAKDGKPVSAVIAGAQHKRADLYFYRYVVDGKEYNGHDVRDWEDEKLHPLAVGEETSVVISASHPWMSSLKPRQTHLVAFPIVVAMLLFECLCIVVLINPRSLSVFNAKQQPPNEDIQQF